MHDREAQVTGGVFLGLMIFLLCLWMLSGMGTAIFTDIGKMFSAMETAASNFIAMAWAISKLLVVVGVGVAVVFGVVKYHQLVKRSVDIMAVNEARCAALEKSIQVTQKEFEDRVRAAVNKLHSQLQDALKKPEAGPEPAKSDASASPAREANEVEITSNTTNPY